MYSLTQVRACACVRVRAYAFGCDWGVESPRAFVVVGLSCGEWGGRVMRRYTCLFDFVPVAPVRCCICDSCSILVL